MMRGRIIAMFLAIALGTTPIGAPLVGWIADHFGARWALRVGAASGFAAAIVGVYYLVRYHCKSIRSQLTRRSGQTNLQQEQTAATEV
jgi:MFS family permease